MPYGITECYLPPGRGDIPAHTPTEASTQLSDQQFLCNSCTPSIQRDATKQFCLVGSWAVWTERNTGVELIIVTEACSESGLKVTRRSAESDSLTSLLTFWPLQRGQLRAGHQSIERERRGLWKFSPLLAGKSCPCVPWVIVDFGATYIA